MTEKLSKWRPWCRRTMLFSLEPRYSTTPSDGFSQAMPSVERA
jgi:hypothetical protein